MDGPWSDYAAPSQAQPAYTGPWNDYAAPEATKAPSALDDLGMGARSVLRAGGGLIDTVSQAINGPVNAAAMALGHKGPVIPGGQFTIAADKLGDQMGLARPQTGAQKTVDLISQGVVGGAIPIGTGLTVGRMLINGLIGGAAAAGGQKAEEIAPEQLKPVAGLVGALATGLVTHGAISAGRIGLSAAGAARDAGAASFSEAAAKNAAARHIAASASDIEAVKANLAQGVDEILPGSTPTTFQQTGDLGLGDLERQQMTKNPVAFAEVRAAQNAARIDALQSIQTEGDPNAVAQGIRKGFDALDEETHAHLTKAIEDAHAKVAATGGEATPEAYGEAIRSAISDAEQTARAREGGLWKAIDPTGDLTGNMTTTRAAAKEIQEALPSTAKPMAGEEAGIFNAAAELPALAPVSDLIALRSRLSTEMRNELIANGRSPSYARLSQLRGAIQDNLANTVSQQVANDSAGVARGTVAPADSLTSRLQDWVNEYRTSQQAGALGGGGESAPTAGPASAATGASSDGAALPASGGSGGASGDQGVSPSVPTFDEAAKARLDAATEATKARARAFGLAPVSNVTAKAGAHDLFRLPEGRVPEKFFHPGPTGYTDMQALYAAVGEAKALPVITDYAAASLKRAAMKPDGTLDASKFERWSASHQDALRALPEDVRSRFQSAAEAARAVEAASASRELALKAYREGAVGKLIGLTDPDAITRTVDSILHAKTAVPEMRILAQAAKKAGPDAVQGLRQAVADGIARRYISNTEVGASGVTQLKADAFQNFVRNNGAALRTVFNDEEVRSMEAIAADIQRSQRSQNAVKIPGQSNSVQDAYALARGGGQMVTHLARAMGVVGGAITHGPAGALAGYFVGPALLGMRAKGIARVDQLITEAMLHPEVARALLERAPASPTAASQMSISRALKASAIGTATSRRQTDQ